MTESFGGLSSATAVFDGVNFLGGTRGTGSAQWEQNVTPQLQQFVTTLNVTF